MERDALEGAAAELSDRAHAARDAGDGELRRFFGKLADELHLASRRTSLDDVDIDYVIAQLEERLEEARVHVKAYPPPDTSGVAEKKRIKPLKEAIAALRAYKPDTPAEAAAPGEAVLPRAASPAPAQAEVSAKRRGAPTAKPTGVNWAAPRGRA
jgi:hypothetical protein